MTPFGRTLKPSKEIIILLKYLRLSLCIEYVTLKNQQRRRDIGMKQVVVGHLTKLYNETLHEQCTSRFYYMHACMYTSANFPKQIVRLILLCA